MKAVDVLGVIRDLFDDVENTSEGVPEEDVISEVITRFEVSAETARNALDHLYRHGEIYQPQDDHVKPTNPR